MRKGWIYYADGSVVEKGTPEAIARARAAEPTGPFIAPDQGDFVSPIDGKTYSGRAGMREHCKIHNVVSNLELKGLPPATVNTEIPNQRPAIREALITTMKRKGLL